MLYESPHHLLIVRSDMLSQEARSLQCSGICRRIKSEKAIKLTCVCRSGRAMSLAVCGFPALSSALKLTCVGGEKLVECPGTIMSPTCAPLAA